MEISYNGRMYYIQRFVLETDQQLIARSWWIMQQLETQDNFEQIVLLSKYWHNIFFKKCTYAKEIIDQIKDYKFV